MGRSHKLRAVGGDRDEAEAVAPAGVIQTIPLPNLPLNEAGMAAYWKWAGKIRDAGQLTDINLAICEGFAIAEHEMHIALAGGKSLRYPQEQRSRWLRKLEKLDVGHSAPPQSSGSNPYARFGFAKRARERRHDLD